jgi:hypothetical protein
MLRDFPGLPESHIAHREPLLTDEINEVVMRSMKRFEFGSEENIKRQLIQVLESDSYACAVQAWQRKWDGSRNDHSRSREGATVSNLDTPKFDSPISITIKRALRRFRSFNFYCHRRSSLVSCQSDHQNSTSNLRLPSNSSSVGDNNNEFVDPTRGFHPLLSVYYLSGEPHGLKSNTSATC